MGSFMDNMLLDSDYICEVYWLALANLQRVDV